MEDMTYSNVPLTARQPMESMYTHIFRIKTIFLTFQFEDTDHQLLRHIIIAVIPNEAEYQLSLTAFGNHQKVYIEQNVEKTTTNSNK